jgi:hypothetical protein
MESHPDAHVDVVGPAVRVEGGLAVGRGGYRGLSVLEDDEEAVALCIDLLAGVGLERRPK